MKFIRIILIGFVWFMFVNFISYAGEVDILLQKLVEKGILTPGEAQEIKTETQEQIKKEIAQGKYSNLPQWLQNISLKGDLRTRYQFRHEKADNNYSKDTHIGRVRMRLGLDTKVNEQIKAGIGIATNSGGDPRSTNISFGDKNSGHSSKMEIRLDYAYAKYSALSWLDIVGGKMLLSDVVWEPVDLIWDTDITPEGAVFALNKKLGSHLDGFMNNAVLFGTADTSTNADPIMLYMVQPGLKYKFNDAISLKSGFSFYSWQNVKNKAYPTDSWYKSSNTKSGTSWVYDYTLITPALELSINEPFKAIGLNVEKLKLFGEYVNNVHISDNNTGFGLGFQLGSDKINKFGDWQCKYIYAMLGKDAILDVTPDSDRYHGKTGMRSHEGIFSFGLGKNTSLGVDVYRSWSIIDTRKAPETVIQVDWNLKF
ncbi:MAG: putative porin [Candidatus Omnitrophica bacterium]|nr:putative porin [Candidatus Omnitrophota bacterium]MCM8823498.1 putative porin [Candidatus Omnitrophota bacterium]MCM8826644.1 putative porin [Candidatus Omnitrophota bacterium]